MVVVPSGSFEMGSPSGETGRFYDEEPVHRVTIERPFAADAELNIRPGDLSRRMENIDTFLHLSP